MEQKLFSNSQTETKIPQVGVYVGNFDLKDKLTGALIGLAKTVNAAKPSKNSLKLILEGLLCTVDTAAVQFAAANSITEAVWQEKQQISDMVYDDYDASKIRREQNDICALKTLILFALRGMAPYAYYACVNDCTDEEVSDFFYEGLAALGEDRSAAELFAVASKTGKINLKCMTMLEGVNAGIYR